MRLLFAFFCLLSSLALAAAAPVEEMPQVPPAPPHVDESPSLEPTPASSKENGVSYQSALVKMVLTLVGLLLLLFLSVRFLRRLGRGSFLGLKSGKSIQVVEKRALSQKTVLYLVDIEGKRVLLSESQCEVRSLAVIDQALTEH